MAFDASQLSQENILRDVHDTTNQSLRVSAFSVPPPGGMEVIISHTDDSIRIGDGVSLVTSTTTGPKVGLDVNVLNSISATIPSGSEFSSYPLEKGTTVNKYAEVTGIAQGIQTTILTYIVPAGKKAFFSRAEYSGTNIAVYDVQVNGNVQDKKRTNYAVSLNDMTNFESNGNTGLPMFAGDVVIVTVLHDRPNVGDFNSRVIIVEVDL